jgi:hypothetical protein
LLKDVRVGFAFYFNHTVLFAFEKHEITPAVLFLPGDDDPLVSLELPPPCEVVANAVLVDLLLCATRALHTLCQLKVFRLENGMNPLLTRYLTGCYVYGVVRNLVYAPKMKKEEYITDRFGTFFMYTMVMPIHAPVSVMRDLRNVEHVLRKMPGPIDRSPW